MNAYRVTRRRGITGPAYEEYAPTHSAARRRVAYWRAYGWQAWAHVWNVRDAQWVGC